MTEGDPGTWSHCGNRSPHGRHHHTIVFNEGPYPNILCNGTPKKEDTMTEKTVEIPLTMLRNLVWAAEDFGQMNKIAANEGKALIAEAERPKVKELVPGSTFTAKTSDNNKKKHRFIYLPSAAYPVIDVHTGGGYYSASVDESTITDIVPPVEPS